MEKEKNIGSMVAAGLLALAAAVGAPQRAEAADGAALLAANCLSCHSAQGGSISRVEGQRKSPEGWQMTITRMQEQHGARIPPEDKRRLIKYLADTRGLAPAETAGWRYLLEHDNNRVETIDERYRDLCARCHSGARFALLPGQARLRLKGLDIDPDLSGVAQAQLLVAQRQERRVGGA